MARLSPPAISAKGVPGGLKSEKVELKMMSEGKVYDLRSPRLSAGRLSVKLEI